MFVLDSVTVADQFPQDGQAGGAQLIAQNGSNGGYASVAGADVYVALGYFSGGMLTWTPEVHAGVGNIILAAGTRGIRFRNYTAGQIATVSAGLSEPAEPPLQLTAGGVATPTPTAASLISKITSKVVASTVVATDLLNGEFSIPAFDTGSVVRLTAWGDCIQNTGAARSPARFQLVFGGTTMVDTSTSGTWTNNATRGAWKVVAEILATSVATQRCVFKLSFYTPGGCFVANTFVTGTGFMQSIGNGGPNTQDILADGVGSAAVSTAIAQILALNVINGFADPAYDVTLLGAMAEFLTV